MILVSMVVGVAHGCCCLDDNYALAGAMYQIDPDQTHQSCRKG